MIATHSESPPADARPVSAFVRSIPTRGLGVLSFLGWLYLSIAVFMLAWVAGTSGLLHWRPILVTSNSMSPAVRQGDVMMVGALPPGTLGQHTVILFDDPARPGSLLTHRVVAANSDGTYTTQGDANHDADPAPVAPSQIRGVGRMVVPMVGTPATWLREGRTTTLLLWSAASLGAVLAALWRPGRRRSRRHT